MVDIVVAHTRIVRVGRMTGGSGMATSASHLRGALLPSATSMSRWRLVSAKLAASDTGKMVKRFAGPHKGSRRRRMVVYTSFNDAHSSGSMVSSAVVFSITRNELSSPMFCVRKASVWWV